VRKRQGKAKNRVQPRQFTVNHAEPIEDLIKVINLIKAEFITFLSYSHTEKISSVTQILTFPLGHKVLLGFKNLCLIRATEKSIVDVDYNYNSLAIVVFNK
jgi:hypothetical protein